MRKFVVYLMLLSFAFMNYAAATPQIKPIPDSISSDIEFSGKTGESKVTFGGSFLEVRVDTRLEEGIELDSDGTIVKYTLAEFEVQAHDPAIELGEGSAAFSLVYDVNARLLKIEGRGDVEGLRHVVRGTVLEEPLKEFVNSVFGYFPQVQLDILDIPDALDGWILYTNEKRPNVDPSGGVVAVVIVLIVCLFLCPTVVGCGIGCTDNNGNIDGVCMKDCTFG